MDIKIKCHDFAGFSFASRNKTHIYRSCFSNSKSPRLSLLTTRFFLNRVLEGFDSHQVQRLDVGFDKRVVDGLCSSRGSFSRWQLFQIVAESFDGDRPIVADGVQGL